MELSIHYFSKCISLFIGFFFKGQIFGLQELVKHKYALDEADERGWFPLHEAAAQPILQILEIILDGKVKISHEIRVAAKKHRAVISHPR